MLVEQPAGSSFAEYEAMRDLALERGLLLVENLNYRFMDVVVEALALLEQGGIGELVNLDVTFAVSLAQAEGPYRDADLPHFAHDLPGGAMRNFASHPASFVAAFAGDFEEVRVVRRNLSGGAGVDELRALVAGPRVTSSVTMSSHAKPAGLWLRLGGDSGAIEVDVHGRRLHAERDGGPLSASARKFAMAQVTCAGWPTWWDASPRRVTTTSRASTVCCGASTRPFARVRPRRCPFTRWT